MKIGLISDSHGHTPRLLKAVELLSMRNVDAIVHCGDICNEQDVRLLNKAGVPAFLTSGNMDRHTARLATAAEKCKVTFHRSFVEVPLGDGQHLVALHGDDHHLLTELVDGQQFPYVCHGHTHRAADERYGNVRVICPGSLHHPRSLKHPSVAILDTQTDQLTFLDLTTKKEVSI